MGGTNFLFGGILLAKNKNSLFSSIKTILSLKPDSEECERLIKKGVPKSKINYGTAVMESLVNEALKGNVSATKQVVAILENPDDEAKSNLSILYKALENDENWKIIRKTKNRFKVCS